MARLTNAAQGYCEVYCQKFGRCFAEPGECIRQGEIAMYEKLKEYESIGLTPELIAEMRADATAMARELKKVKAERDAAMADVQRCCATCALCSQNNDTGEMCPWSFDCNQVDGDHWEWRGAKDTNVPTKEE